MSRLRQKMPDAVNQLVEKYVPAPSKQLAPYVPAGTIFIFTPRPQNRGLVVEGGRWGCLVEGARLGSWDPSRVHALESMVLVSPGLHATTRGMPGDVVCWDLL